MGSTLKDMLDVSVFKVVRKKKENEITTNTEILVLKIETIMHA